MTAADTSTDQERLWVRAAQGGDTEAFRRLLDAYDRRLLYFVRRFLPDVHQAFDVLCAYAPPEQPTADERQFIRDVIDAVAAGELSPAARQQLHPLLNRPSAPWFREELGRLAAR